MKKDKLYIVMPAYNEEENILDVVKSWYPILKNGNEESKLVIADSGSSDKTNSILKNLQKKYKNLVIVSDSMKQHGPKLMYLYDYAIKNKADWIFQTDSDGQTSPDEFILFWKKRNDYDILLGNRPVREDGKSRKYVEKVLCLLLKIFFKVKIKDSNAPFRLMKASVVKKYIKKMPNDYNLPNVMFTTYFVKYNENYIFIDITFRPRQGGTNSINLRKIFKIAIKSLKDFNNFRKEMKRERKN